MFFPALHDLKFGIGKSDQSHRNTCEHDPLDDMLAHSALGPRKRQNIDGLQGTWHKKVRNMEDARIRIL